MTNTTDVAAPHVPPRRASLRGQLSRYFRRRRAAPLRSFIERVAEGKDSICILDVGGRPQYWEQIGLDFLSKNRVSIVLLNITATELNGIADNERGIFEAVVGDACRMDYPDGWFDAVHSNSVIEHVETWRNMKAFASEIRRVGRHYFVQTPYFWFPVDPHYYGVPLFHWLPRPIRARLLRWLPLATSGKAKDVDASFEFVDAARLLCRHQFHYLFPDAKHSFEKFVGLPKSMIADR